MRFSSSFKVGILTLTAIIILVFTVLWVKGRTLTGGERLSVEFKDINGMRVGSGVQMMGVRIGQVEELIPKIDGENSGVIVRFVITEPNVNIPTASTISIQQSGLIGEQFLEITPPQTKILYIPINNQSLVLHVNDKVQMQLSKKYYDVGTVKKIEIIETNTLPLTTRENLKTKVAYKVGYIIDLPGLILPDTLKGSLVLDNGNEKLRLSPEGVMEIPYPQTNSKYTVIEPMRISDFMELQYRSAASLAETNEKLSLLLSEDVINDLKETAVNVKLLTANANSILEKADALIESSKGELLTLSGNANSLAEKISKLVDNLNAVAGDKDFVANVSKSVDSVGQLSNNLNKVLEDPNTKATLENIHVTSQNIAELSNYINNMSKDTQLKYSIAETVKKMNCALDKLNVTLDTVNYATADPKDREKIKETLKDVSETSANLRKFSQKLNKRFLLFRLMF